jgi:hypothetical protein
MSFTAQDLLVCTGGWAARDLLAQVSPIKALLHLPINLYPNLLHHTMLHVADPLFLYALTVSSSGKRKICDVECCYLIAFYYKSLAN